MRAHDEVKKLHKPYSHVVVVGNTIVVLIYCIRSC